MFSDVLSNIIVHICVHHRTHYKGKTYSNYVQKENYQKYSGIYNKRNHSYDGLTNKIYLSKKET